MAAAARAGAPGYCHKPPAGHAARPWHSVASAAKELVGHAAFSFQLSLVSRADALQLNN